MITLNVFVANPRAPREKGRTALSRARAASRRFGGRVEVCLRALDSLEAERLGAAVDPTVALDELILAAGQPPLAGHLVRALEVALEEENS